MATTTFDTGSDQPTDSQKAAEAAALEQGEKIAAMQQEDLAAKYARDAADNESPDLIGGKFKSQDDLLKAYEELQRKLSSGEESGEEVDTPEEGVDTETAEESQEEVSEARTAIERASAAYAESGDLSEETIEQLSQMDSKELIRAYMESYKANTAKQQAATTAQADADAIVASAGGADKYAEMIAWAGENFSADEIEAYNQATQNPAAARFAVETLKNRYTAAEGYEAPLVTGGKSAPKATGYRSNAELARDIADPRYQSDPAFRQDVEAKLARSAELL